MAALDKQYVNHLYIVASSSYVYDLCGLKVPTLGRQAFVTHLESDHSNVKHSRRRDPSFNAQTCRERENRPNSRVRIQRGSTSTRRWSWLARRSTSPGKDTDDSSTNHRQTENLRAMSGVAIDSTKYIRDQNYQCIVYQNARSATALVKTPWLRSAAISLRTGYLIFPLHKCNSWTHEVHGLAQIQLWRKHFAHVGPELVILNWDRHNRTSTTHYSTFDSFLTGYITALRKLNIERRMARGPTA